MPDGRTGMEKTCACHPAALDPWSIGKSKARPRFFFFRFSSENRWWLEASSAHSDHVELLQSKGAVIHAGLEKF